MNPSLDQDIVSQVLASPDDAESSKEECHVQNTNALLALGDSIDQITKTLKSLKIQLATAKKEQLRMLNELKKLRTEKREKRGTGFYKPMRVSDELCELLGLTKGSAYTRIGIQKMLYGYIKFHKLQDPNDGRNIIPDEALSKTFRISSGDKLTYFNIQRYLRDHLRSI